MGGKYIAELTKEVMADLVDSKYQLVEWRVSIYGNPTVPLTKHATLFV